MGIFKKLFGKDKTRIIANNKNQETKETKLQKNL